MELSDLKGKKIALLGMGLENIFLADFLLQKGIIDLEIRDQKDLLEIGESVADEARELLNSILPRIPKHSFGPDYLKNLNEFDVIFRTPGLPYLAREIQEAKKAGVIISSQIKLFIGLCSAKIIGVTGTKGKGTTASLIKAIMKQNHQDTRNKIQTNTKSQSSNEQTQTTHLVQRSPIPLRGTGVKAHPRGDENLKSQFQTQDSGLRTSDSQQVFLLGNIGQAAVDYLDKIKSDDVVILELSSFQLQDLDKSPHIAVVTNLGEDHLNYHKDLEEYWGSKANILKYQAKSDFAVINQDYLSTFELATQTDAKTYYFSGKNSVDEGAFVKKSQDTRNPSTSSGPLRGKIPASPAGGQVNSNTQIKEVILKTEEQEALVCRSDELKIVGNHNLENVAAAAIVGKLLNIDISNIRKAVLDFKGLEHRLEFVTEKNGVKYFNDSFATNPLATLAALKAFNQPIILILGGSEKELDFTNLIDEIVNNQYIKSVVYIGEAGEKLSLRLKALGYDKLIPGGDSMSNIVRVALEQATSGDVVLLSPACASFGMFKDYKDRGQRFKEAIQKLT